MNEVLLHLRRSENGHFVLIEPSSQTVVVAETLDEAHARMGEALKEAPPPATPVASSRATFALRGRVRIAAIVAALLVPLAWTAWIAVEVGQAQLGCPPRPTRSQGHETRVAQTPSAFADREGIEDDEEAEDDAPKTAEETGSAPAEKPAEAAGPVEAAKDAEADGPVEAPKAEAPKGKRPAGAPGPRPAAGVTPTP
jgi:hypothetical protein